MSKKGLAAKSFLLLFLVFFVFYGGGQEIFAQLEVVERRSQLEQELSDLEAEIQKQRVELENRKNERVSLERDVAILTAEIKKAKLSIRARDLTIEKINQDIKAKTGVIGELSDKIDREKESLAELIRKTNALDSYSLVEVVLTNSDISDFFSDLDSFRAIKNALRDSFQEISIDKKRTEDQRAFLEDKKTEEVELRAIQDLERKKTEEQEKKKKDILEVSKGVERVYQQVLLSQERSAASIRAELFVLRGTAAIPFEQALALANLAGKKTDIRPALILAIIAEESNLGENVGTGNWRTDMKEPRDTVPFREITSRLGLDPDKMPVSKKPWYGWGGAMGPAQFIPSTWILYEDRIAKATGHNPPNPWDPGDAFMAASILLMDNGADKGGYAAERLAALRYFAGWKNATKSAYAFYGDDVMALAEKYQKLIDILGAN